ncbi:MAG: nuclear transport factor 2 family protein [Pyrinomonadaceae bacterium]|nr:nuclear transport factor 2 family protein [Pyrinomonadaceae bacterium]
MNDNEKLIQHFYNSFAQRDYKAMQDCYADDATFSDEAFQNLNSAQVKAMWEMLIKSGKDLEIRFQNVSADEKNGSAEWIANYTFSQTGNKVENRIKANFEFANGKIVKHIDSFDFYKWSSQALGLTGKLLGWTSFLKKKVSEKAMKSLAEFMERNR